MAEETLILNIEVDQGDAERQLKRTESTLLSLKKTQQDLSKEYRSGKITQEQYVDANLDLQKAIKKESDQKRTLVKLIDTESNSRNAMRNRVAVLTREYNNLNLATDEGRKRSIALQKELKTLNDTLNKGSKDAGNFKDNIGNYAESVKEAAGEINIGGVSVGNLTGQLTKFANPATAAVGILGALTSAYAQSSVGSQDLSFATGVLSNQFTILNNKLAELINTGEKSGRGGGGIFSRIASGIAGVIDPVSGILSESAALQQERLKDLEVSLIFAQGFAKDAEKRAEDARRNRDSEEKSLQERLQESVRIEDELNYAGQIRVTVLQSQLQTIKSISAILGNSNLPEIQKEIANREREIKDIQEEVNGKLTENVTARQNILKLIKEEQELIEFNRRESTKPNKRPLREKLNATDKLSQERLLQDANLQIDIRERLNKELKRLDEDRKIREIRQMDAMREYRKMSAERDLEVLAGFFGSISGLFDQQSEAYKVTASAQTLISTYSAAQKAYESQFIPGDPTSLFRAILAASGAVISGLGRVAQINEIKFAQGGFTGSGFGRPDETGFKPAGIVHEGEYVAPKNVVNLPSAQPHIAALEGMRTRKYADGGFVKNSIASAADQGMMFINAVRSLPTPQVSVKEITKAQSRITVRENIASR